MAATDTWHVDEHGRGQRPAAGKGFRPDVEGLRAIAVGLVLIYHGGVTFVSGGYIGVDVFFVISGFLITGLLIRELERTNTISLPTFYARRAKRLLPATAVVIITTAALVFAFVPRVRWADIGGDLIGSAIYLVNWRFADRSVDYLAEGSGASPMQHFWSLAVEEQYYLVWPVLVLLFTLYARRRGRSLRPPLYLALLAVAVPSFLWSVYYSSASPEAAFFVTTTRMWELAIGGGLAIAAPQLARLPRLLAGLLGWIGLGTVLVAAVLIDSSATWPGYLAAAPTLGTAAVIVAGMVPHNRGPAWLLSRRPMVWVGGLSYSLYLWHWPLLIVAIAIWGELPLWLSLAIVVFSVVPSWVTQQLVENPIRYSQLISSAPRYALSVGANCTLLGVVAGLVVVLAVPSQSQPAEGQAAPGAEALEGEGGAERNIEEAIWQSAESGEITPDPLYATEDVPELYDDGCQVGEDSADVEACIYGVEDPETTIVLTGDSKAGQWLPGLQTVAEDNDWQIVTVTKSACPFSAAPVSLDGEEYSTCTEWNSAVVDEVIGLEPDLVLTSQSDGLSSEPPDDGAGGMVDGLVDHWERLQSEGIAVAAIADTPHPGFEAYECVAENLDDLTECSFPMPEIDANPVLQEAAERTDAGYIDLLDSVCVDGTCPPVIGGALVNRQGSHLTATYVETLAPQLEEGIHNVLEQQPTEGP